MIPMAGVSAVICGGRLLQNQRALGRGNDIRTSSAPERSWQVALVCVSLALCDAEIFYQNLRLSDEQARLRAGCALVDRPRLRASRERIRCRRRAPEYV